MKIKELSLTNFRRFEQLDLKLPDSNFIILIGENGCGKSSVLDAMGISLHTIIDKLQGKYRIRRSILSGSYQKKDDVHFNKEKSIIEMRADGHLGNIITKDIFTSDDVKKLHEANSEKLQNISQNIDNVKYLPLLVYYNLNRTNLVKEKNDDEPVLVGYNLSLKNPILEGYLLGLFSKISSFYNFEYWFISQENIENEQKIINEDFNYQLTSLKVVRQALEVFLTEINNEEFTNLRARRANQPSLQSNKYSNQIELIIQKNNKEIKIKQLSSGEKMILLLVCDIARRLLILNSMDENCLEGEGVVLIDEIEMHLHPKWQRRIVPALRKVFPNIQFIATTHSPQVLSNLSDNEIIVLDDNKYYSPASNPYGRDSNGILEEIFGTTERPAKADKLVDEIFDILSNGQHDIPKAETKLGELRGHLGAQDPILLRIENLINRKKILTQ